MLSLFVILFTLLILFILSLLFHLIHNLAANHRHHAMRF